MEAARRRCREVLGAGPRAARGRKRGRREEPALEHAAETLVAWENARTSAHREVEMGTIADALRARKQQENKVLLGLVAIGTPREGAALTLKDASTVACAEEDLAKLLVKDSDHEKAVAVVLAERARSTLSTCLRHDGLAVIVTSFTIHDLWQPKPETGLLSGAREAASATPVMESSPTGYAWADYPLGSLSQTCLRHGVYLEIDDLFVLNPRAVTTEVQGSLPLLVRAVSPVIQANQSDQPYALVHVADPENRKDRFLVLRKGAQTLATVLRPGDTLEILGGMAGLAEERVHHIADGSRAKKYHNLTASTPIRVVPRIPDEAVWATAGTETGSSAVSQQSSRELSSECSYMGRISRRIGAFVLELDGITKVFFSHVHRLYFHGVFAGFVMTMRSTVSILNFAPLPHDTTNDNDVSRLACVRMSPSQQALLPSHLDALTSFWVLASLVQLSYHLTPRVLHAVSFFTKTRDFLASVAASQGRADAVRDIWDEFMLGNPLGMQGQARISNDRPSAAPVTLPLFVSVQKIKQGALTFLQRQGVRKLPSVKNGIKDMHKENHFVSLSAETAAQSMGQPVALVGCMETSEKTGQLIFRDRTDTIEIYLTQALEDYVHKMLSSKSSTNADTPLMLALTSCSISIEALHARSLRDIRLTRQPQSGVPILLWDDQYIEADPDREGVFRLYLEAAEFHQVSFDERPFRPRTFAPGPEMGHHLETVPSFAVMTKVAAILDDGSGQGQLFVDGPMALRVLGMDSRQHALHLRDLTRDAVGGKVVFKSGNLPMYAQGLENVDVKELKNLPPPQRAQAEFERFVMARQLSTTEKLFIYAKCKHNLSQSDRTMFHREQAYFAPINVGKKDTVLTASLPKLVLIGLHVERVDDSAALARALLFP
ncbi:Hypothetical Protein FCC1311_064862 [Hondaea fermentalgiana]|uniref:Uncharacterized protein n=1 Tax=Hondaea fermentalgiana TaxID=2315210 RepID=A0A2R5GH96_9STRA|nr:Hypothetical Protein FCC1311_064862 [Hondaea fermentalgiana]|eukprot:GBG30267.1 Hypothetical Protein FCC1311_064862 [Hondaea fermentalgiana]